MTIDNETRADRAEAALNAYIERRGYEDDTGSDIADLLGDIMHFCKIEGIDFDKKLTVAQVNYAAETEGKGRT
jgi:hypothetical protein